MTIGGPKKVGKLAVKFIYLSSAWKTQEGVFLSFQSEINLNDILNVVPP